MPSHAVLFDVDGTLVDTTYLHTLCWWQAFRQYEFDPTMAIVHRSVGMGAGELVSEVLGDQAGEADVDALSTAHDALYAAYWPRLRPLPGAQALLRRCHQAGLVVVLASSASPREVGVLLEVLDSDDAIDHVTSSGDADRSKPAPDIVEVALIKAGVPAKHAVFVGDAVWDVAAAGKAGVPCIGLESGGTSARELAEASAIATYRDAADLLTAFPSSALGTLTSRSGAL